MHPDYANLLAAVLDDPANDLPRLIAADWLEENGQPERAEFIRVQIALVSEPETVIDYPRSLEEAKARDLRLLHPTKPNPRHATLKARERELLRDNIGRWIGDLPEELVTEQCPSCVDRAPDWETNVVECRRCDSTGIVDSFETVDFTRGFISSITLPRSALHHLPAIMARCPIERVTVEGVEFLITTDASEATQPYERWAVQSANTAMCKPTRSALVAGIVPWIESVLPRFANGPTFIGGTRSQPRQMR